MHVVLSSWGSRGDVAPLAALAKELIALDADVTVCAPPDPDFEALLASVGVPLTPLGPSVKSVVAAGRKPDAAKAFELAPALVAARFVTLGTVARDADVLVATGLMPAGARSVAEHYGVRYRCACYHLAGLPSRHFAPLSRPGTPSPAGETDRATLWRQDAERVNALYGPAENTHRAAWGMPPLDSVRDYALGDRPLLAADPLLCPWADLVEPAVEQTGAWFLPDERPLPVEVEEFLAAGPPPVYVGFGSIAALLPTEIGAVAVEAIRRTGRRILLQRGWADLALDEVGEDALLVGELNHRALFGRVAAVVHHGGAGTTQTAAAAGAAQVIVPQIADQPLWGRRIADLGMGAVHDGPRPTVESLGALLDAALSPEAADRARAVARQVVLDGAAVAARLLLAG